MSTSTHDISSVSDHDNDHVKRFRASYSWLSQARLAINIPDLSAYEDTLQVIGEISKYTKRCYVLTVEGQELSIAQRQEWPHLSLVPLSRQRFPNRAARWITQRVAAEGVEVIHDFFGHFSRFCERAHKPQRPYIMVHTQRTTNWGWFDRVRPKRYQIDKRYASQRARSLWYDTRIIHAVDHVTVMGPGHERDLIHGHRLSPDKVTFIPSETDSDRFTPRGQSNDKETISASSITDQVLTLLYVGAFVRAKGLEILFDLFEQLGAEYSNLQLILIGRETPFERRWFQERVRAHPLSERLEVYSFMPREELIDHYRSAHLFVFPSLFEGSPRALREAVACGLSVVASEIPGHRGVDPQERFIRFAPLDCLNTWIKLTREALTESSFDREQRVERGVQWLRTHHHPKVIAQRWLMLYHQIAQRRGLTQSSSQAHSDLS